MSAISTTVESPSFPPLAAGQAPRSLREAIEEFCQHGSPRVLAAALGAALLCRAWVGDWSAWDLVPVAIILAFWPIQEWLIHVWVLHFRPTTLAGRSIDFRVPQSHRAHHRDPWNLDLVFIPFHSFSYSLPILLGLCFLLTPSTPLALTALTCHLALSLHYEWVHFLVHTRYVPRSRYYERLRLKHRWHHFKNEHYWFGVTRLSGDRLLGTAPGLNDVPTSPTCRTLGVDMESPKVRNDGQGLRTED